MSLRTRLMWSFAALVVIPLVVVGLGIRHNMTSRLTEQFGNRVSALASFIQMDLAEESRNIGDRLEALAQAITEDNRFRTAAVQGAASERSYLLDYATGSMNLSGLQMLQIQDDSGRILSSGHFRNEYDRLEPELPPALAAVSEGTALVNARTAQTPFLALVKVDSFMLGARWFHLVGGTSAEHGFLDRLAGDAALAVSLVYPGGVSSSDRELETRMSVVIGDGGEEDGPDLEELLPDFIVTEVEVPYVALREGRRIYSASIVVTHPLTQLHELRRSIDLWFTAAVVVTAIAALTVATWLSSHLSRPLSDLARKTSEIDLDRLDVGFDSDRTDEVGALSVLLGTMTRRLRKSAARLKEVERRAAIGEMARQVNHDIKNGLIPIRNVLRHLREVADDNPGQLPSVLIERQGTLNTSVAHLEDLAANYARLYPQTERRPCDVNDMIRVLGQNLRLAGRTDLKMELGERVPPVMGDPVALRRIIENLTGNAVDAIGSETGTVTISTSLCENMVQICIEDTGPGMTAEQLERVFEDFYTTKSDGTGLGLSIVRRLVLDMGGTLRVESEPGVGTKFTVELHMGAGGEPQA